MDEQDAETTVYNALEIKDLSIIADIKATNPGFSTHTHEYMENCQRCVVAYEARRRGYHVIAKPRILSRTDPLPYMTIGREHYGIKINDVKEVVPDIEITNVPEKQSVYICGIMKCRYGCVSVFDIYKLFNIEPASVSKIFIILTIDEKMLAFSAESVDCVVDVSSENIYDIPLIFNDAGQRYIQNVIVSDHNLVPIIDTARLFEKIGVLAGTELLPQ